MCRTNSLRLRDSAVSRNCHGALGGLGEHGEAFRRTTWESAAEIARGLSLSRLSTSDLSVCPTARARVQPSDVAGGEAPLRVTGNSRTRMCITHLEVHSYSSPVIRMACPWQIKWRGRDSCRAKTVRFFQRLSFSASLTSHMPAGRLPRWVSGFWCFKHACTGTFPAAR